MPNPVIWLSGAQPDILASFPHDRPKYVGTGSAILFTSAMAAGSSAFALHMALKAPVLAAIPLGLLWGLGIMGLDRWLVASMTRRQGMLLVAPRVLLALLFSIVISTPLTLEIFNSEIAQQMSLDHAAAAASFATSPNVAKLQTKVNADQATVTGYQGVISSGGATTAAAPGSDQALTQLQAKLASDQNQVTYYRTAAHCEQYGGTGCTTVVGGNVVQGTGSAYTYDETELSSYTQQVKTDNQNIATEEGAFAARNKTNEASAVINARTNLTHAQAQLTTDTNALSQLKNNFNVTNTNNTGILARLKALDELRMSNINMLIAEIVLFLFFAAIELLPVIVKVLLNRGEETAYEQAVAAADVVNVMREEYAQRSRYLETIRRYNQEATQARAVQAAWEDQVMPDMVRLTLDAKRQVEQDRIARWRERELFENTRLPRDWEPTGLSRIGRARRAELGWTKFTWFRVRWLPWGSARRNPPSRIAATGSAHRAIDSGDLPKAPGPYGPGWTRP